MRRTLANYFIYLERLSKDFRRFELRPKLIVIIIRRWKVAKQKRGDAQPRFPLFDRLFLLLFFFIFFFFTFSSDCHLSPLPAPSPSSPPPAHQKKKKQILLSYKIWLGRQTDFI